MSTTKSTHPLLLKYLTQLSHHPLRTKAITTGNILCLNFGPRLFANSLTAILCFLQEVLGSHLSGTPANVSKGASAMVRSLQSVHFNAKAVKMAIYGFLISAPMSHMLVGLLQKAFAGKTSLRARVAQIIANNLLVSPIQASGNSAFQKCFSFFTFFQYTLPLWP
jgi:peroxisomal membrane protein 2